MRMPISREVLRRAIVAIALLLSSPAVWTLSSTTFADNSKLAQGRWVKIAVDENGIYQLTSTELRQMGFNDPSQVKVFGYGGHQMSEHITEYAKDDLEQVPTLLTDDGKVCFYANGVYEMTGVLNNSPKYFDVTLNAYSLNGYYFLTDDSRYDALSPQTFDFTASSNELITHSYAYYYHEEELASPGITGKNLLGENITYTKQHSWQVQLPNIAEGSTVHVTAVVAGKLSGVGTIKAKLNDSPVSFSTGYTIGISDDTHEHYKSATARGTIDVDACPENSDFTISVATQESVTRLFIDRFIISYTQENRLPATASQVRLNVDYSFAGRNLQVLNVNDGVKVWDVSNPQSPTQMQMQLDAATHTGLFTIPTTRPWSAYVAFDPQRELKSIKGYEEVENQNLHAIATPDYVIVTTDELVEQAERIAQRHRDNGMDVLVMPQRYIFNEFSSGAADPSAVRMFMKMLYDRNPSKLNYLLLFGDGTYDNRRIIDRNTHEKIVTYQSNRSDNEVQSYVTDDYFGMLSDNTSTNMSALPLSIAIGRISSTTVEEATAVVDKIEEYVATPDYGEWRNNAFVVADDGDDSIHEYQAVGIANQLDGGVSPLMNVWRIYDGSYPNKDGRSEDSRDVMRELLKRGQLFFSYIGHGALLSGTCLWDRSDAESTQYDKLPFATFATCDVARFDADAHGVAEQMLFERDGGVIACLAATRVVYSNYNDNLNRALLSYLFSLDHNGNRRTIGEACRLAKNMLTSDYEANKLKFVLFGDPALTLDYPLPLAQITSVNGTDVTGGTAATVYPQTAVSVSGTVTNSDNTIDTSFNGEVTVSLYDKETMYSDLADANNGTVEPRVAMLSRELLARTTAQVTAGRYTATLVVPANCMAQGEGGLIRVYAHTDDGDKIVDGMTANVTIQAFDDAQAITDVTAPVINAMYIDDESFIDGDYTGSSIMLYASMTDEVGISVKSLSIGGSIFLSLDGGLNTYPDVKGCLTLDDGATVGTLSYPIERLPEGPHTLTLTVADVAGNVTSRTVSFYVIDQSQAAQLQVASRTAVTEAVFDITMPDGSAPESPIELTVVGSDGKIVMSRTVGAFPYSWNLTGNDGNKVKPGLYRYYGNATDGSVQVVATNGGEIVVLEL